jgi:SAM-dependent methyltransferase
MSQAHWQDLYSSRSPDEVSWFESDPVGSRIRISQAVAKGARSVVDVGGGASRLVDHLVNLGLDRIVVVDASWTALDIAKRRLGDRADMVEWIAADVTDLEDIGRVDVWHDRALFHFLIDRNDRVRYVGLCERSLPAEGVAIMAAFAPDGPERCSGLEVRRYDAAGLAAECGPGFHLISSDSYVHTTPRGVRQSFLYSTFRRAA